MATIQDRVKVFVETWERRRSGELPPVDLRVTCEVCGKVVMGDDTVQFTRRGLICNGCLDKGETRSGIGVSSYREYR